MERGGERGVLIYGGASRGKTKAGKAREVR